MALRVDSVLLVLGDKRGMYCAGAAGAGVCVSHKTRSRPPGPSLHFEGAYFYL